MLNPWFPKGYIIEDAEEDAKKLVIQKLSFADDNWQIYKLTNGSNVLICEQELVDKWVNYDLLTDAMFKEIGFTGKHLKYLVSSKRNMLAPINYKFFDVFKSTALIFAHSLRETRKILPKLPLEDAIYVEQYARLLPLSDLAGEADDSLLLGTWLAGGVPVPTTSIRRLKSLTLNFSQEDLEEIIEAAGLIKPVVCKTADEDNEDDEPMPKRPRALCADKKFSLPGATYLEKFFFENVIDIVQHPDRYANMGIGFPSPIILYGKPGTGKTYSVEKLAEFLDWPVYSINSSTIGSKFIHETGQKIAAIFNKAFENSPSIVIIDEMEAYLGQREGAQDFKVEEVGEFLRLIPEATKNNVLVVGMTNLLKNIDPAILRTGRFDHKIEVKMPTAEDIKNMFDAALSKLPVEKDINLEKAIQELTDKPRSDVAFVVKEAARLTAFRGKNKISQEEIDAALEARKATESGSTKRKIGF